MFIPLVFNALLYVMMFLYSKCDLETVFLFRMILNNIFLYFYFVDLQLVIFLFKFICNFCFEFKFICMYICNVTD